MIEEIKELKETLERSLQNPLLIDREKTERFYKGIINLQQKVEQLEKENKELKYDCSCSFHDAEELNQNLTEIIDERNELDTKLIQLENIRKESIEYIEDKMELTKECPQDLLNILNKGE